jgi:prephenate dehydrogenase
VTELNTKRLALVGTGLIGASVGLAAKRAGAESIRGYDADAEALETALRSGAVDVPCASVADAVSGAELVVVATPVALIPSLVAEALSTDDECAVTDVGSTKGDLCAGLASESRFVGGHPVCGSEARGPANATEDLFEGATWFLTPLPTTAPEPYGAVHGLVTALGAVPTAIEPRAHDRLVALTSHLPHALANLLVNQAGAGRVEGHEPLASAGGSLRDMTRVAGANPSVWLDILLANAAEVVSALEDHRKRVEELEARLRRGDARALRGWIDEAARNRQRLLTAVYEGADDLHALRVHVSNRPGELAGITQALGSERINIEGFDLDHLSAERGGTLTLLVAGRENATRAASLVEKAGYGVVISSATRDPQTT